MRTIFITATGTDIGKTLITTALCYQCQQQNLRVRALKPVISGWSDTESDTVRILQSQSLAASTSAIERTSPWRFIAPLSPDMAAAKEGKSLSVAEIADFCLASAEDDDIDILIIEGAGGLMTPLNDRETMLDLMEWLQPEVVLVTGSYLGSLSHTLTALETLTARKLPPRALIVSESEPSTVSLDATVQSLQHFTGAPIITVPRLHATSPLWMLVPDMGLV